MQKVLFTFVIFCVSVVSTQAQDSYSKKLHQYLELSGSLDAFKVGIKSMIGNIKKMKSDVPDDFLAELEKECLTTSLDDLVELLEPVYKQQFTESDIDEIIKFYKSPIGVKMAEKTPVIMQQSMQAGQAWGQKLGEKIAARMKEKGYELK